MATLDSFFEIARDYLGMNINRKEHNVPWVAIDLAQFFFQHPDKGSTEDRELVRSVLDSLDKDGTHGLS